MISIKEHQRARPSTRNCYKNKRGMSTINIMQGLCLSRTPSSRSLALAVLLSSLLLLLCGDVETNPGPFPLPPSSMSSSSSSSPSSSSQNVPVPVQMLSSSSPSFVITLRESVGDEPIVVGDKSKNTHCAWCSAIGCSNSRNNRPDLSFYRFPRDPERCKQWIINTGRADLEGRSSVLLSRNNRLCSVHFEKDAFKNKLSQKSGLVKGAVPTLFAVPDPHLKPSRCASRRPRRKRKMHLTDPNAPEPPSHLKAESGDTDDYCSYLKRKLCVEQTRNWRLRKKLQSYVGGTPEQSSEDETAVGGGEGDECGKGKRQQMKTFENNGTAAMPKFFDYMKLVGNMKQIKRTGWVRTGVKDPESIAEHMYRMAVVAFALPADSKLDRNKCLKIALVHDMSETIVGDLTPWCGVSKQEKSQREEAATSHIASLLPPEGGTEVYELWKEYETQSSPEAKFVKDLDKFEMMFQAFEYETSENRPRELQEFFSHTMATHTFSTEIVKNWANELQDVRDREEPTLALGDIKSEPEGNIKQEPDVEADDGEAEDGDVRIQPESHRSPSPTPVFAKEIKVENIEKGRDS